MDLMTTLEYLISSFCGYYIGCYISNYFIYRHDYDKLKRTLENIESRLNIISINLESTKR
jgi:hypothetical protein